jgi:hypothetical protein
VIGPVAAGRADEDRVRIRHAEDLDARVHLRDVDEAPRPQIVLRDGLAVGAQRGFGVDPRGHVADMRGRHVLEEHRLEVEHVDRLRGARDERSARLELGELRGAVHPAERERGRGKERTCGQPLKKAAAVFEPVEGRHGIPPFEE